MIDFFKFMNANIIHITICNIVRIPLLVVANQGTGEMKVYRSMSKEYWTQHRSLWIIFTLEKSLQTLLYFDYNLRIEGFSLNHNFFIMVEIFLQFNGLKIISEIISFIIIDWHKCHYWNVMKYPHFKYFSVSYFENFVLKFFLNIQSLIRRFSSKVSFTAVENS